MNKFFLLFIMIPSLGYPQTKKSATDNVHYVCIQSSDTYHDNSQCSALQLCTGGKIRKVKNVSHLKPCKKCAHPVQVIRASGFDDVKRVLGVKDKVQIKDSLGSAASAFHRDGYTLRISGPPGARTVNQIEFFFDQPIRFDEDSLTAQGFYKKLGLNFKGCKADTIRSKTPHPVTNSIKKDFTIEYRGCEIVEAKDAYENTGLYYYELSFISVDRDAGTYVDKILLLLKADQR